MQNSYRSKTNPAPHCAHHAIALLHAIERFVSAAINEPKIANVFRHRLIVKLINQHIKYLCRKLSKPALVRALRDYSIDVFITVFPLSDEARDDFGRVL